MHGCFPGQCKSPSLAPPNLLSGGLLTLRISLTAPPFLLSPDLKHWSTDYLDCGGTKQSPINVDTAQAIFSPDLRPIQLSGYSLPANQLLKLKNNGHTGGGRGSCRAWSTRRGCSDSPSRTGLLCCPSPGLWEADCLAGCLPAFFPSRPKGKPQAVEILHVHLFSQTM